MEKSTAITALLCLTWLLVWRFLLRDSLRRAIARLAEAGSREVDRLAEIVTTGVSAKFFGWQGLVKRAVDVIAAFTGLIAALPLLVMLAGIVLIETGRPVLISDERIGRGGRRLKIWRFCTRKASHAPSGRTPEMGRQPAASKIGALIDRWDLHFLPMLFSVLVGDIALIGPSPDRFTGLESDARSAIMKVLTEVKPGLIGVADIVARARRQRLSPLHEAMLEVLYVNNWSLSMDARLAVIWIMSNIGGGGGPGTFLLGIDLDVEKRRILVPSPVAS